MNWYVINLGDAMLADEKLCVIEATFQRAYKLAECPLEMAVFKRHELEQGLHCELKIYFAPAAQSVAIELGAQLSSKPSVHGLGLLAGSKQSTQVLFAE